MVRRPRGDRKSRGAPWCPPTYFVRPLSRHPARRRDRVIGGHGEDHVVNLLDELDDCALFRPFPDNETDEIVVRRLATGKTVGLQVKTAQLDQAHAYRNVLVNRSSFIPDPATYLAALAWIVPKRRFHQSCLLIPSDVVPSIAGMSGPYYELHFRPDGSSEPSKVDRYRIPLDALAEEIGRRLGGVAS